MLPAGPSLWRRSAAYVLSPIVAQKLQIAFWPSALDRYRGGCIIAYALAFLSLVSVARANDLIGALVAYSVMDFETAAPQFTKLAEDGVPEAQTRLGVMYLHGEGVPLDIPAATRWLMLAAEQGSTEAPMALVEALSKAGSPDYRLALPYLKLAATKNVGEANTAIGEFYLFGLGTAPSFNEALGWFRKGADAFDPKAFFYLGVCFSSGLGAELNTLEAAKWFQLAWRTSTPEESPPEFEIAYRSSRELLTPIQSRLADQSANEFVASRGGSNWHP